MKFLVPCDWGISNAYSLATKQCKNLQNGLCLITKSAVDRKNHEKPKHDKSRDTLRAGILLLKKP
jgi:hypothetical protein